MAFLVRKILLNNLVFKKLNSVFCLVFFLSSLISAQENLSNSEEQAEVTNQAAFKEFGEANVFSSPLPLITGIKDVKTVYTADLDNDGDMDVLTGSETLNRVAWLENLGNFSFQPRLLSATVGGATKIFAADLDNDGDTDVISTAQATQGIYWFENLGNKQFTQRLLASEGDGVRGLYAAHLNDDAYIDVLSISYTTFNTGHKISWYDNRAGNFTANLIPTGLLRPDDLDAADIDNDGDVDVLVFVSDLNERGFYGFRNDGQNQFTQTGLWGFRRDSGVLKAADLDGDNDIDIVASDGNKLAWLKNLGNWNFEAIFFHTFQYAYSGIEDIDIADLDGDGDLDIMSVSFRGGGVGYINNFVYWYKNNGNGNFTPHNISTLIEYPAAIHAVDLDNDADMEILVAAKEDHKIIYYENNTTSILPPVANFSADVTSGGVPLTVAFTENTIGTISEWHWDFGDGTTSNLPNPVHTYQTVDTFSVTLTVSGPLGADSLTYENYIIVSQFPLPIANFTANALSGFVPLTVTFTEHTSGAIDFWHWDFGDGQTSSLPNPTHTYQTPDTFSVTLIAGGPGGSDTLTRENFIKVWPLPPVAGFSANVISGDVPLQVKFSDSSSGAINQWYWDFGDGATSTLSNPVHTYRSPGTFSVSLIVSGSAGSDTLTREDYITVHPILPPVADFSADVTFGKVPLKVQFTENTSGTVQRYFWDFGDGMISRLPNPVHFYQTKGIFSVILIVSGPLGTDTLTRENYIRPGHNGRNLGKVDVLPEDYQLHQNYPNPFNPQTAIQYDIPESGHVSLQIFDSRGKMLRTLVDEIAPAGIHHVEWDGKDSAGKAVGSGVYFYRLKAGNTVLSRKMLLLR